MNLASERRFLDQGLGWMSALAAAATLGGCSTRLSRENILANTETAYGLSVSQNTKTQAPEVKLGYFRHEFFYVPSSKTILYEDNQKGLGGEQDATWQAEGFNDPSNTPEVLAEIAIRSGGTSRLQSDQQDGGRPASATANFRVRQRLAIGKLAVTSGAAVALMSDQPLDAGTAAALISSANPADNQLRAELDELLKKPLKQAESCGGRSYATDRTMNYARCLAGEISGGDTLDNVRALGGENLKKLVETLKSKIH